MADPSQEIPARVHIKQADRLHAGHPSQSFALRGQSERPQEVAKIVAAHFLARGDVPEPGKLIGPGGDEGPAIRSENGCGEATRALPTGARQADRKSVV